MASDLDLEHLEESFARVAEQLLRPGSVVETLQHIVALAAETIDGCDAAGVFLAREGAVATAAASSSLSDTLDRLQIEAHEGPCIDASARGSTFYAHDLAADKRWPTFGPEAAALGVRSVLSYSLSVERLSALNLYAHLPSAFGATDRAQGQLFATLARLALELAEERAADGQRLANLTDALRTRELIGQAQGILMERERITADLAFDVLRRASQRLNVKLRSVAERLVETGESPAVRGHSSDG